jgi:hypothetical protein
MAIRVGSGKKIPQVRCLNCADPFSSVSNVEGEAAPCEGAYVVCSKCGHIMGFDKSLQLRSLDNADLQLIARRLRNK